MAGLFKYKEDDGEIETPLEPKQFEKSTKTAAKKLKGKVRVKKKKQSIDLESDKIELSKGDYIKFIGITSVDRTPLFSSNDKYVYFLELTNNLDFIATSILGGELDKMTLISEKTKELEKCQFIVKNNVIFLVYGSFPDKKGKWVLEQMIKHFRELTIGKDVNNLEKFEKYNIQLKFKSMIGFILKEYVKLQEVFSDQDIPYVEDEIRIDYMGLSSKSIGVISLLLGDDLNIEVPPGLPPEDQKEMAESVLTAKIEALAANTLGNTGSVPRWIAVKHGFQNYRFLTFKEYENEYFLSCLSAGNLEKITKVEEMLNPYIKKVTNQPFSGSLRPFNQLKLRFMEIFEEERRFS